MNAIQAVERVAALPPATAAAAAANGRAALAGVALPREYLSFRLGTEEYGIDILKVQEIRGYEAPIRVVGAPSYVSGVTNLRGVVVPIVDLRSKFGMGSCNYDGSAVTIVLTVAGRVIGMVVDSVSDVIALAPGQIKPAPKLSSTVATDYIVGLGAAKQGSQESMLILIDIELLMTGADLGLAASPLH